MSPALRAKRYQPLQKWRQFFGFISATQSRNQVIQRLLIIGIQAQSRLELLDCFSGFSRLEILLSESVPGERKIRLELDRFARLFEGLAKLGRTRSRALPDQDSASK